MSRDDAEAVFVMPMRLAPPTLVSPARRRLMTCKSPVAAELWIAPRSPAPKPEAMKSLRLEVVLRPVTSSEAPGRMVTLPPLMPRAVSAPSLRMPSSMRQVARPASAAPLRVWMPIPVLTTRPLPTTPAA